jgi:hypothetical protein
MSRLRAASATQPFSSAFGGLDCGHHAEALRRADQQFVLDRDVDRGERLDHLAEAGRVDRDAAEQTALLHP